MGEDFEALQAELGDLRGPEGSQRRVAAYRSHFQRLGRGVVIGPGCRFRHPDRIELDDDAALNEGVMVFGSGGVRIGRHARIGPRVFVHSANHDISPGPLAFHERGYAYAPVQIGDGCLLSAGVQVMPGSTLGGGSFVAAGAVVTSGAHGPGSRLFGIPARPASEDPAGGHPMTPAEPLALRAHTTTAARQARVVLSHLGLPQVTVLEPEQDAGPHVRDVQDVGRPTSTPTIRRRFRTAPVHDPEDTDQLAQAATLTVYYAIKRRRKRPPDSAWEQVRWQFAVAALDQLGDREHAAALAAATGEDPRGLDPALADELLQHAPVGDSVRASLRAGRATALRPEAVAQAPAVLTWLAVQAPDVAAELAQSHLLEALTLATNTARIADLAMCAALLGRAQDLAAARERLLVQQSDSGLLRVAPDSAAFSYDPVVAAALAHLAGPAANSADHEVTQAVRPAAGDLDDLVAAAIDRLTPPTMTAAQLELDEASLHHPLHEVTTALLDALGEFASAADVDLVELRPWPVGYDHALSLRFDIDRASTTSHARGLIAAAVAGLGAAPGSWYGIPGTPHLDHLRPVLDRHHQEIGVHAQRPEDLCPDLGTTWHSAPTSAYWRGRESVAALDSSGAAYGELLTTQLDVPGPVWLDDGAMPWCTPLHFPLEGSTNDRTLAYFDRLRPHAETLRERGGHVIVGTHSDVSPDLLSALLEEPSWRVGWLAPVGVVVERVRALRGPGRVRWVTDGEYQGLSADTYLSDVVVRRHRWQEVSVVTLVPRTLRPM